MARAKNPNLKKANQEVEFTYEQIQELKKCADDPVHFIENYVKVQHPVRGMVPLILYDYQKDMIRSYHANRFTVVLSARQTGKPLFIHEQIPTPDGYKTMEELQVGDYVLNAEGKPTRITATSPIQYGKKCYKVHFSTGEYITADAEHLWEVEYVENVKNKKRILTTQQMVDAGVLRSNNRGYTEGKFNVKLTKPLELPKRDLPIDPYVLGAWLGDGAANAPVITNHLQDYQIVEQIEHHFNVSNITHHTISEGTKQYYFKGLRTKLKELGVFNDKHIPITYLRSSHDQRLSLLQGLMDTDGDINPKTGLCEITFTNKRLAEDTQELISTLGLKATIKERHIRGKLPHIRWTITFTPYLTQCNPFRLKRKAKWVKQSAHPTRLKSTQKRTIVKIEPTESVPVKCIVVDNPDHLFLVGRSLIPTHNSVTSGAYILWYAIFHFDKTILIASNKNSNAMEMIHRIKLSYENLPYWLKPGIQEDGWNKHTVGFDNGTRVISEATSENSGRGLSISLLYLDEFAFVPPDVQQEFWTSISPTLSTGGSCIMTSTPNGDTNIFAEIWRGSQIPKNGTDGVGINGFMPIRVRWDQPPGRDEKFKEEEMSRVGERMWKQEYECEFISSDALLINSVTLQNLTGKLANVKPKFKIKDVIFWYDVIPGKTYLVGVDPATGTGNDYTVITVFQFPEMKQIAEFRSNTTSTNDAYDVLKNLLNFLLKYETTVYFSVENNGVGEGIISLFEADDDQPDVEFVSENGRGKRGMTTTSKKKMKACINFREMLERGNLDITSPVLLKELKTFVRKRGAYDHQQGATSDCISACLIVIRLIEEIATYDQAAFDKLYAGGTDIDSWTDEDIEHFNEGGDDSPLPVVL